MVALCRANSIPARTVYGLTVDWTNTPKHTWVEVYFEEIGWVSFDPTPGNGATFNTMSNRYVCFFPEGYDEKLTPNYYWRYRYWGAKPDLKEKSIIQ